MVRQNTHKDTTESLNDPLNELSAQCQTFRPGLFLNLNSSYFSSQKVGSLNCTWCLCASVILPSTPVTARTVVLPYLLRVFLVVSIS